MDIVEVTHMFLDGGGREDHVYQISRQLARLGHNITIITSDYTPSGQYILKQKIDKVPGVKLVTLKGYPTKLPPGRIHIPDLADFLMDYKADIIHAHGMGEQPSEDAFYVAKTRKIPFVFTLHYAPPKIYRKLGAEHMWEVIQKYQTTTMLRGADRVVSVSPDERKDIMKFTGWNGRNSVVIPNGFERPPEKVTEKKIRGTFQKFGIPDDCTIITYLGALTNPRKGGFEAIQAFRSAMLKNRNLHLVIIGTFDERLDFKGQPAMSAKILEKLAKANHVTVVGNVYDQDKHNLLAGSDIFLSPTYYEAFGIALAESLYNRTPVIATDIGGCRYVVRKNKDGILVKNPEDIGILTEKLLYLINHSQKAAEMGQAGHERVDRTFSWERTGQQLDLLYKHLVRAVR
jgi:glycosyltransferase involved in cell wall biosynthesis